MEEIEITIPDDQYLSAYLHLRDHSNIDVELLYGGRDSGKSYCVAMILIEECMKNSHFRGVISKKTHESIKDAQWQMIKDIVEDWGIDQFFRFTKSPLEITCVNGGKFISRGLDSPGKVRSITNPTHLWIEEGNQLSEADYINLSTTLRSNHGRVKEYISFNPEAENGKPENHWLYKMFYAGVQNMYKNFVRTVQIRISESKTVDLTYRSTHSTYLDNPFVTEERIAKLEKYKLTHPFYYDVFCLGIWGVKRTGQEMFSKVWNRSVHIKPVGADYGRPFHLWLDFNRIPYSTCLIVQMDQAGKRIQVKFIDQICLDPPANSIEHTERIFSYKYGRCKSMYFSGDPTGKNETQAKTTDEAKSMFDQFERSFKKYLHNTSNKVLSKAPPLVGRMQAWNDIFSGSVGIDVIVDPKVKNLISDIESAVEDTTGGWMKKKEMSETLQKRVEVVGHALDASTYGMASMFPSLFFPR